MNEKKDIKREDMITPGCVWPWRRFNATVRECSARVEASGRIQHGRDQQTELGHVSRGERGKGERQEVRARRPGGREDKRIKSTCLAHTA